MVPFWQEGQRFRSTPVILNMEYGVKYEYGVKSTLGSVQLIFNPPDSQGYFPTQFHVKPLVNLDLKGLRADLTPFLTPFPLFRAVETEKILLTHLSIHNT